MKKLLLFLLLPLIAAAQEGNNQADIGGLLIASNFAQWTVPQGNQGGYSWSSPDFCKVQFAGTDFNAFSVGTPVAIVDTGNPSNSETVTVNQFNSQTGGCSITVNPTHVHNTFFFRSATAGLGEALAYAGKQAFQIIVTPDFTKLGGTTSTITSAKGGTNVPILDQRSSVIVPYIWDGTEYAAQPFAGGAINPGGTIGAIQYYAAGPNFGGLNGTGLVKDNGASPPTIATPGTDYALPNANTTGTAGNLSGTPALPNGTTATTQAVADNTTKIATDAFVLANQGSGGGAPTGPCGGALSGTYPNCTIVGTTIQPAIVDGAVYAAGVNGAGIGVAQSSWSSATAYPQCSAVSHSGNYLGVAASTNVTPGTNSAIWYPVPNGNTPTAGDCAFYLAASKVNGVAGAQLILPPGITATNLGFVEPTVTSPGNPVVAIMGAGKQASILRQTASISNAVITQPNTAVAFAFAGLDLEGFTVDANFLAPAAINVYGAQQFKLAHLRLENPTDGSDHYIEFGHPSTANHTLAWTYEPELDDIDTLNSHGPGSGAGLSVSVSGGVPTITINSGGTSYNPTYSQLVLSGSGAFADVPCTSRGTDTINVSGGVISSITTTATGCTGPLYASVFGGNQVTYCFKFNDTSDSKLISGLTPSECNTGVYNSNAVSQMKFIGTHPIATYAGIVDQGNNTYLATQIDSVYRYGFDLQGATNIDSISATDFEYSLYLPGASDYHVLHTTGSPTTAPFAVYISSDLCGNAPSFGGYYHFITPSGGGNSFIPAFVHAYESISCDSHGAANLPDYAGNWSAGGSITANGNLYGWNGIADMVSVNQAKLAYQFNDVTALGQALSNSQWLFDDVTGDTDVVWQSGHSLRFGIANSNSAAYFDSAGLFHAGGVTLSGTFTSNGPAALNGASTAVTQTIGDSSNKIATTSFVNSAISSGNIFGNIYPAQCAGSGAPSWCSGSTPDAYIRAACTQLPSTGGNIYLYGLTGNLAASAPCSTTTKKVNIYTDNTTNLNVTETDGGTVFPLDNTSTFNGPGVGQCLSTAGIHVSSSANIAAVIGPAHTDGTQENFAVTGACITGTVGSTVSQGYLFEKNNFANTTFQGNVVTQCNGSYCLKVQNGSDIRIFNNWLNASGGNTSIVGQPLLILGSGNGTGFNIGPVEVFNNQIEHAQGANSAEITIVGDGAGALTGSIHLFGNGIERDTGGTPSTTGISITDCQSCYVQGLAISGSSGGTDAIKVSQSTSGRTQNVEISSILGGGAYTNILNDTTPNPLVPQPMPYATYPQIGRYPVAPGVEAPISTVGTMNLLNAYGGTTLGYELNGGVVVGSATSSANLLTDSATNDVALINSSGSNRVLLGILANHSAEQISTAAVGFSLPVTMPSLAINGATADTSLSSGTASNTDLNGILAVVSATTASYSFQRTTAYTSHPICLAEEEGSTPAAVSVSYTGVASVTFHFASFTGNVDYICTGQN